VKRHQRRKLKAWVHRQGDERIKEERKAIEKRAKAQLSTENEAYLKAIENISKQYPARKPAKKAAAGEILSRNNN